MALDQALENTGVALTDGKAIYTSVFVTRKKYTTAMRLHKIDSFITRVIQQLQLSHLVVEECYPSRFRNAAMLLASVFYTVTNACMRYEIPYTVLQTASAKNSGVSWTNILGLKGTKEYCREWLRSLHPQTETINALEEHEVDAIGLLWAKMVITEAFSIEDIKLLPIIRVTPNAILTLRPIEDNFIHETVILPQVSVEV